ncbi:hypothetical protein BB559_006070 [Furculomyces boomerangus]|uniref:Cytochrome P450 n=2 Tax=Harpellales TaxID=61421 RepID=A0A2T9Y4W6_9FUNG|nr:hypothetical protein BB559_006070 [Furculomyces boomerangus]PWA01298.1 hypothetical protein BB558_002620 [Smittium angustum]
MSYLLPKNRFPLILNTKVIAGVLGTYTVSKLVYQAFFNPLNVIPGPWWVRFTSIPYIISLLRGNIVEFMSDLHEKFGPVVRVNPNEVSITCGSDIKRILSSYKYEKSKRYSNMNDICEDIFTTRSESYNKMRRKQVAPAFTHHGLETVDDVIMEVGIESLYQKFDEEINRNGGKSTTINYYNTFQNVSTDIIGELALGKSFNSIKNGGHLIIDYINIAIVMGALRTMLPFLIVLYYIVPKVVKLRNKAIKFTLDAIDERRKQNEENSYKPKRDDILQMYITAINSTNQKKLSNSELIKELVVMIGAGVDTTSTTMTWILHLYMMYPSVYQKVVKEINDSFPDRSKLIRYQEARKKLVYFVATVYESMRFRSVSGAPTYRMSSGDGVFLKDNTFIPPNTEMGLFIKGAHMDENVWNNPKSFNPDRFLGEEGEKLKKEVLAFGAGVRICPGKNLAWMEIFTILPNLIRKYEFKLPKDSIFGPQHVDETTGEPILAKASAYIVTAPTYPQRDCNIVISHKENV